MLQLQYNIQISEFLVRTTVKIQHTGDTKSLYVFEGFFGVFKEEPLQLEVFIPLPLEVTGGGQTHRNRTSSRTSQLID